LAAEVAPAAPDLAAVLSAWLDLPEAVRAGIAAMVKASGADAGRDDARCGVEQRERVK